MFLAKTRKAEQVLSDYLKLNNLTHIPVRFMSHSSVENSIHTRNYTRNFDRFFHSFGNSGMKSTPEIVDCWLMHPEFPTITILGKDLTRYEDKQRDNINYVQGPVDIPELFKLQSENSIHICPSTREGYGHYINNGRSSSSLILATDFGPMNEFIRNYSGVPIKFSRHNSEDYQLFPNIQVYVSKSGICDAVTRVLEDLSIDDRIEYGRRARSMYEADRTFMKETMRQLKQEVEDRINKRE